MTRFSLGLCAGLLLTGSAHAVQVNVTVYGADCQSGMGYAAASGYSGQAPYTFTWSSGDSGDQVALPPGQYTVTVTDNVGDTGSVEFVINNPSGPPDGVNLLQNVVTEWLEPCQGQCNGGFRLYLPLVVGGYFIYTSPSMQVQVYPMELGDQVETWMRYEIVGACPGQQVSLTVSNSCGGSGSTTVTIPAALLDPVVGISQITGSCTGTGNGYLAGTVTLPIPMVQTTPWNMQAVDSQGGMISTEPLNFQAIAETDTVTPFELFGLHPGDWNLRFTSQEYDGTIQSPCVVEFPVTIPDLGSNCGSVSGTVYIDNDQDCVQDPGEPGVPFQVLEILPSQDYAITGNDGHYAFDIPDGAYTLGQTDPTLIQLCPSTAPVPFTVAGNQAVIHLADSSTVPMNLSAQLEQTAMRPGFQGHLWGLVRNMSPRTAGAVTVTMELDAALVYVDATPAPTSIAGNTLVWELPVFPGYLQQVFRVYVQVPVATPLGTPLSSTLLASSSLPEANTANNSATANSQVTGSYDPNVKQARTSTGYSSTQYFIGLDDHIDYTIHFQNTGTDTAFTVVVTDTLGETLDQSTFQQGVASHPFNVAFKPGRLVEWTFTNILLPDSGTNEAASHGLVSFRIRPKLPLLPGTAIANSANIYFDFNEPVITEPCVLTAEIGTGVAGTGAEQVRLMPNPTDGLLYVQLPEGVDRAFSVWSADGRRVAVPFVRTGTTLRLDVHGLAPGLYVLRTGNGVARFVKQ